MKVVAFICANMRTCRWISVEAAVNAVHNGGALISTQAWAMTSQPLLFHVDSQTRVRFRAIHKYSQILHRKNHFDGHARITKELQRCVEPACCAKLRNVTSWSEITCRTLFHNIVSSIINNRMVRVIQQRGDGLGSGPSCWTRVTGSGQIGQSIRSQRGRAGSALFWRVIITSDDSPKKTEVISIVYNKDLLVKILSTIINGWADSFLYALPFKVAFINLPQNQFAQHPNSCWSSKYLFNTRAIDFYVPHPF